MKISLVAAASLAAVLGSTVCPAQGFALPDFANSPPLSVRGDTAIVGTALVVTDGGTNRTGSAWYAMPQSVATGFETEFEFRQTGRSEGFAFVIQASAQGTGALGGPLWGLGYGPGFGGSGISDSLAFEFDANRQLFLSDTTSDLEFSVHTQGTLPNSANEGASLARLSPAPAIDDGQTHRLRIEYVSNPGRVDVFIDDLSSPALSFDYTFENGGTLVTSGAPVGGVTLVPDGRAFVGFTGTTGSAGGQVVEILSWTFTERFPPPSCYEGNVLVGGAPVDVLTVSGSAGGFYRTVELETGAPFSIDLMPPPGESVAAYVLALSLGISDGSSPLTVPGIGTLCSSNAVTFTPMLAPGSIAFPPGLQLDLRFTAQAGMWIGLVDPTARAVTNAVAVDISPGFPPIVDGHLPTSAPVGAPISVIGDRFSQFATVEIGGVTVTPISVTTTEIVFAVPPGVPCDQVLRVRHPDGKSTVSPVPFHPTPTVNNVPFTTGPVAGGTPWVAIGSGFSPGTTVEFDGVPALNINTTTTSIVGQTPPASGPGQVTVVVTTPGGCTFTTDYTYF